MTNLSFPGRIVQILKVLVTLKFIIIENVCFSTQLSQNSLHKYSSLKIDQFFCYLGRDDMLGTITFLITRYLLYIFVLALQFTCYQNLKGLLVEYKDYLHRLIIYLDAGGV